MGFPCPKWAALHETLAASVPARILTKSMAKNAPKQSDRGLETLRDRQYWIIHKMYEDCLGQSEKLHPLYGTEEWRLEQELQELCDIANLCRDVGMDIVKKIYQYFDRSGIAENS